MGLCAFPCLLWSIYQPPRVVVQSEPDGTPCKIYLRFQQLLKVGNCRGGLCQEKQHYEEIKRIKRDVSTTTLSGQNTTAAPQKVVKSGPGSAKPGTPRGDPLERRRREMWDRCDCVSIRGLFLDMSLPSGLGRGSRGRRGKRRKVGCRVICLFLIYRYKNDPKWASLFAARLGTVASTNARNATSGLSEGTSSVRNVTSEQTSGSSSKMSTGGLGSESYGTEINGPGATENAGSGISTRQGAGSPAAGALNGGNLNTGGGTPGGNILSTSSGSVKVSATGSSITGSSGVPQNADNMGRGEVSNITAGATVLTSAGSGSRLSTVSPGSASSASNGTEGGLEAGTLRKPSQITANPSGISGPPATVSGITELGNSAETSRGQHGGAVTAINSTGSTSGRDNTSALPSTGTLGRVTPPSHTASSSSGEGTTNTVIGGVGSSVIGSGSAGSLEKSSKNTSAGGLLEGGKNFPPRPTAGSVSVPSNVTPSETSSETTIPAGTGEAGSGGNGVVSGSSSGSSTINPLAGSLENAGGLNSAISSSGTTTSSVEEGGNLTSVLTGGSESRAVTANGISATGSRSGTTESSSSGASSVATGFPRGGGVSNEKENVSGLSGNGTIGSGSVPVGTTIPGHPSVTTATSSVSSGAEDVGTISKPMEASGTSSRKPGSATVPVTVSSKPNGAGSETNSAISSAARRTSGEDGRASARGTTGSSSTVLPSGTRHSVSGSTLVEGTGSYGGGSGGGAGYATANFPNNNGPYNFDGAYGRGAGGFSIIGSGMNSGPWGLPGSTYNAYGNSGGFGNMPGVYTANNLNAGSSAGYAANGGNSGNIGLFDDDIFFQN